VRQRARDLVVKHDALQDRLSPVGELGQRRRKLRLDVREARKRGGAQRSPKR
jgi:hypothetical protein